MFIHNQLLASRRRRPRGHAIAVVTLALAGLLIGRPVLAQDTPKELLIKASTALSQGDYKQAIPFLAGVVQMLGESKTPAVVMELETVYFNLGMSYFLTGNFAEAETTFDAYIKKYRQGVHAKEVAVYRAEALRFQNNTPAALKAYAEALNKHSFDADWKTDIYCSMAKCHLSDERWKEASQFLERIVQDAPDFFRRNWAASIMVASYLKNKDLNKAYKMTEYLMHPNSFAARSVYLNMTALEAGDLLFEDEKSRDALWVYRLIYPKDVLQTNCENYRDHLSQRIEYLRKLNSSNKMRELLRAQENLGEVEREIESLAEVKDYDSELFFRIGRSYQSINRNREARDLFYYLYQDAAATNRVEECLYLAFSSAAQAHPQDRALEIGDEYMTRYPAGEYYGEVTLNCGQIYVSIQDWPNAVNTLTNALGVMSNHPYVTECMFMLGYAYFMQEQFTNSVKWLTDLNTQHPGNDRRADATYWLGMANMFDKKYKEAEIFFNQIIADHPDSQYVEDSCFRSATCDFGLSLFAKAEPKYLAFLDRYPQSKLRGEAYLSLGDISGVLAVLPQAVKRYQKAAECPDLNIELYNYAIFRCGEILMDLKYYDAVINHFEAYIQRNREDSNIPMAIYWVGNAYWQKGQQEAALAYYRQAIEKFGKDRKELGIDLILEEWVGRTRTASKEIAKNCWRDMNNLHRDAVAKNEKTLALRIERILLFDPAADDAARAKLTQSILQDNNIEVASAGILELMEEEATKADKRDLALKAANKLVADFTETDYALRARMLIARDAIRRGDDDAAITHLTVVREVFVASLEAGDARLLLGDLYLKQGNDAEANRAYKEVTESKDWKKLWPAALYGRAEILRAQKKFKEASAFYERIYVLYSGHSNWAAKAYLKRAECLDQIFERQKAIQVLEEMVAQPELQTKPEIEEARQLLAKFKKQAS